MLNYKIVGFSNNNITLEFDGIKMNFVLPIVDGNYPVGTELDTLLTTYITNAKSSAALNIPATNAASILALVVPPTQEQIATSVRFRRDQLIGMTDKTQLSDIALTVAQQDLWKIYRKGLRDLPTQLGFPSDVTWPVPPAVIQTLQGVALTDINGVPTLPVFY